MNTQIFYLNKCDLKGHKSSSKFSVNPTLPLFDGLLMLPFQNCLDLSLSTFFYLPLSFSFSLPISLSFFLFCSMQKLIYTQLNVFHKIKYGIN